MTDIFRRKGQRHIESKTHVTTEAEIVVMQLQVKGCPGLTATTRKRPGRSYPYRFQRDHGPANTLILDC